MSARAGVLAIAFLLKSAPVPGSKDVTAFRYLREVVLPGAPASASQSCAVLDGTVYAHAAPTLADLRLFRGSGGLPGEIPYALTVSETAFTSDAAAVLNLGGRGQTVVFDLQMPERLYSGLVLRLGGENFLAAAKVTGLKHLKDANGTALGTFTLFDLTRQRLGRQTTMALAESSFPFLHVELAFSAAPGAAHFNTTPGLVEGAEVPPSREAQTLYTAVAETRAVVERGRESVAEFELPAHVPVERVSFVLQPGFAGNFSRVVRISAKAVKASGNETPGSEELGGEISRVRLTQDGETIRESSLGVPAILGSNGQSAATVRVVVENGDDAPVGIQAVRLEMRERKLCFETSVGEVGLYYGADGVKAPVYDYSRLFRSAETARTGRLGPEMKNPAYVAGVEARSFSEQHPGLVWVGLVGTVVILGGVAWRSAKRV